MYANPGRIADDDVESTGSGNVGEVRRKGEGKRGAFAQRFDFVSDISQAAADSLEAQTCLVIGRMPQSEQVSGTYKHQQLLALGVEANSSTRQDIDGGGALEPVKSARQRELSRPGGSHVSSAKTRQFATTSYGASIVECGSAERVANADVPIEIRQRRNPHWIWLVTLDDYREPETELAQPHRHRIEVDAEDGRRQNATANLGERSGLTTLPTK